MKHSERETHNSAARARGVGGREGGAESVRGSCWSAGGQVGRAWPRAQAVTVTRSDTPSPPAPANRKSSASSCLGEQPPMTF